MAQIIMAGHNFTEAGWDSNMVRCAEAAKMAHHALALGLVDMANRAEFGAEIAKIGKKHSSSPSYLNYLKGV